MQSVLITGVAGLIGSRMAEWIIQNHPEYEVIGIDNLSGGYKEQVPAAVHFLELDLSKDDIDIAFAGKNIQYVFHFAAYAAEGLSPFIRRFNYSNNLVATANVVNKCIEYNVQRLVFTSSMAVYGIGQPPFDETHAPSPIDPYGVAKYACEMDIRIAGDQHKLDWCIVRPHNVYGSNQNIWDKYRNVLGIWMYQKINGLPFYIFGDGSQKRSFTNINDCLLPFWKAATQANCSKQVINLGATTATSILEAATILRDIVGGAEIEFLEQRHEVKDALPGHDKSIALLQYADTTPLHDGLQGMWEWALQQPKRERREWDTYELNKGMYASWQIKKDK
jgi:UDP-glucose 4-epimerase